MGRLSGLMQNLTFARLESEDLQRLRDPNLIKMFKMYQLGVEYLLYAQNYYAAVAKAKDQEYQSTFERSAALEAQVKTQAKVIATVKTEIEYKKKHLAVYEQLLKLTSERNIKPLRCKLCDGKYFANQRYLHEHYARRHSRYLETEHDHEPDPAERGRENKDANRKDARAEAETGVEVEVEEGQIVLKTDAQEKQEREQREALLQEEARRTAQSIVKEQMQGVAGELESLRQERAQDKLTIGQLMERFETMQREERRKEETRQDEKDSAREAEIQRLRGTLAQLQDSLKSMEQDVRTREEHSEQQLGRLTQQLATRDAQEKARREQSAQEMREAIQQKEQAHSEQLRKLEERVKAEMARDHAKRAQPEAAQRQMPQQERAAEEARVKATIEEFLGKQKEMEAAHQAEKKKMQEQLERVQKQVEQQESALGRKHQQAAEQLAEVKRLHQEMEEKAEQQAKELGQSQA